MKLESKTKFLRCMQERTHKAYLAASCLLCTAVSWRIGYDLDGTEFSGGSVTGPLLEMQDMGNLLFLLVLPLIFVFQRIAAAIMLLACLLCLPLYLFFTAPGPLRWIFRGEWTVQRVTSSVWNWWSIAGIGTLILASFVCLRTFSASPGRRKQATPKRQ